MHTFVCKRKFDRKTRVQSAETEKHSSLRAKVHLLKGTREGSMDKEVQTRTSR